MTTNPDNKAAERKQHLAGLFDRVAPLYDQIGPAMFAHFGRRLIELAQIPAGAHILDVATGRGAVFFPAIRAVGPSGHVTGIDLSERMVWQTSQELARRGIRNGEVHPMDAEHLLFSDASFDYLVSGFSLFFFPRLETALAEFRRVLKPNGRIAVSTWARLGGERTWFDDLVKQYLPPDADANAASPQEPRSVFDKPEGMEEIVRAAGFADIRVVTETADFVFLSEEEWWSSMWSHGTRNCLERIEKAAGPQGLGQLKASAFEHLQTIKQPDGIHRPRGALFTLAVKPSSPA